jgi:hypothetical protein
MGDKTQAFPQQTRKQKKRLGVQGLTEMRKRENAQT